ncbi:MAG: TolC family protein [Planctomycetota bacterium]
MLRPAFALVALGLTVGCHGARERDARAAYDALTASFAARAETPAPLTSESPLALYVDLALARNATLQAAAQRWRAELERVPQAWALPEPRLSYGGFVEPVETRVGPQRHSVALAQRIPWPGKLDAAEALALERAEAGRARTETARRRVIAEVTRAYAALWMLRRELALTEDTLALLQHWESVAQVRLQAGAAGAHRDVIKAQVEIGRLEDQVQSLRHQRRPRAQRLIALLALPRTTELPWPARLPERALSVAPAALLTTFAERSPRRVELEREVAVRERALAASRQAYFPDVVLGFTHINVGHARSPGVRGSGDDAWIVNAGIDLPVWIGRYAAAVSEAEARLEAARLERDALDDGLAAELAQGLFAYQDAERKLRLYRDSLVPKALQSLEATSAAYETGAGDFLDLLDAERALLELHLAQERALADRLTALADLELLTGSDLAHPLED